MIEIKNIHITYNRDIIKNSNIVLYDKGITIIKGESGSGKTSLIRNILFQEKQFDEYIYNNQKITDKNQIDYLFSIMSQKNSFIEDLTIKDHFELLQKIYRQKEIDDYIERLEVAPAFAKYPNQLSGGEKNRISFLFCLLKSSPIIILDEPTAALDSYFTEVIKDIIIKEAKEHLFIISSHDKVLFDIADRIYKIKNQRLHLVKDKVMDIRSNFQPVRQKMNIIKFFMKMKKHNLISYIFMTVLLVISIVATSLTAGYSLTDQNNYYDKLASLMSNEIIAYKPIMQAHTYYFSGDGLERIMTDEDIEMLRNIENVSEIIPHIELTLAGNLETFDGDFYEQEITVDCNGQETEYGSDFLFSTITLINYTEIDEDEIEYHLADDGIYISNSLAQILGIDKNGDYELSFLFPVPHNIIVGDGLMSYMEEEELYPTDRVYCKYVPVQLKVAGVLKTDKLCYWSHNTASSIFIPQDIFMKYINEYNSTETKTYYFDEELFEYTEEYNEEHEISNTCYSYPWSPNAYKVKLESLKYYTQVVDELEEMGFATITANEDFLKIERINYHTSETLVIFSIGVTVILAIIHFILKYVNLYKEKSFKLFFREQNYSKMKINLLMIEKYLLNTFIIMLFSLVSLYAFQQISSQNGFILVPTTSLSLYMVIGLSVMIEFIFPVVLGGVCRDRT